MTRSKLSETGLETHQQPLILHQIFSLAVPLFNYQKLKYKC